MPVPLDEVRPMVRLARKLRRRGRRVASLQERICLVLVIGTPEECGADPGLSAGARDRRWVRFRWEDDEEQVGTISSLAAWADRVLP